MSGLEKLSIGSNLFKLKGPRRKPRPTFRMFVLLLLCIIGQGKALSVIFQQPDLYSSTVVKHTVSSLGGNVVESTNIGKTLTGLFNE